MKRKILLCLIWLLFFGSYSTILADDLAIITPVGDNVWQDGNSQDQSNPEQGKWESALSNAWWCSWIKLNTNFPIIWNCIEYKSDKENPTNAFSYMIWALTKIIMSLILVVCFIFIIVAGIMWAWAWEDNGQVTKAKWILKKVAIVILLLWFSWAILRLINPTFFS